MADKRFLRAALFPREKQLQVLEAGRRAETSEAALELAKQLDLGGDVQSNETLHTDVDGHKLLALYRKTGAFWYADFTKLYSADYAPKLPSQDRAAKVATKYLESKKWLPKNYKIDGVHKVEHETVQGRKARRPTTSVSITVPPSAITRATVQAPRSKSSSATRERLLDCFGQRRSGTAMPNIPYFPETRSKRHCAASLATLRMN